MVDDVRYHRHSNVQGRTSQEVAGNKSSSRHVSNASLRDSPSVPRTTAREVKGVKAMTVRPTRGEAPGGGSGRHVVGEVLQRRQRARHNLHSARRDLCPPNRASVRCRQAMRSGRDQPFCWRAPPPHQQSSAEQRLGCGSNEVCSIASAAPESISRPIRCETRAADVQAREDN